MMLPTMQSAMLRSKAACPAAMRPTFVMRPAPARPRVVKSQAAASELLSAVPATQAKMMCFQCEQTADHTGCTVIGNCGKTPEVAGLQDLLIYSIKGLASLAHLARQQGVTCEKVDDFLVKAMFATLTNVNFHDERFEEYVTTSIKLQESLAAKLAKAGKTVVPPPEVAWFTGGMPHPLRWNQQSAAVLSEMTIMDMMEAAKQCGIIARQAVLGKTLAGLQELVVYGLKGLCAYFAHAQALGVRDAEVDAFVEECLHFLSSPASGDVGNVLAMALKVGTVNYKVMAHLSEGHIAELGQPEPTEVSQVPVPGKAILVTGHDMHDLRLLLEQTEGKGVNVYTHGEMMPAHGYPGLKKFKHLKGHFGGAWYRQKVDFSHFPGSILVTTNCVLEPMTVYRKNIFTTNETGLANVPHLGNKDYSVLIDRALALPGFDEKTCESIALKTEVKKSVTVGFGHHAVLGVAGEVVDAVKTGKLSHIFLVGGCDGHEPQRDYYSKLGKEMPTDTMLLTLGCGKFRLINQEFGNLPGTGLPRLLDMGQCNDAYSALVVATELAKAFNTDVNSLPLSLDISWFEQKAVAVLLTLLSLGVKNIRLGPALPAFLTAEAVNVLVDHYALKPADTAHPLEDLKKMMASK